MEPSRQGLRNVAVGAVATLIVICRVNRLLRAKRAVVSVPVGVNGIVQP